MSEAGASQKLTPEPMRWRKPDEYHIVSVCGRFNVARKTVNGVDWYIAYRREDCVDFVRGHELGATQVRRLATDAERLAAIREMQQMCEAAA